MSIQHDKITSIYSVFESLFVSKITIDSRIRSLGEVRVYDSAKPFLTTQSYSRGRLSVRQSTDTSSCGIFFVLFKEDVDASIPTVYHCNNPDDVISQITTQTECLTYIPEFTNHGRKYTEGHYAWLMQFHHNASGNRAAGSLLFRYSISSSTAKNWTTKAYLNNTVTTTALNFTGQHINCAEKNISDYSDKIGLIVVSCGKYKNYDSDKIEINEALPVVELSSIRCQKTVFGVISSLDNNGDSHVGFGPFVTIREKKEDRLVINSIGEGAIWVCNINGNLENGDYITSCEIPGYGMKQEEDILMNYTVAKITCDCDFSLDNKEYICEEFEHNGKIYKKAFVGCTYHCG